MFVHCDLYDDTDFFLILFKNIIYRKHSHCLCILEQVATKLGSSGQLAATIPLRDCNPMS